jgi:hypothetical protein
VTLDQHNAPRGIYVIARQQSGWELLGLFFMLLGGIGATLLFPLIIFRALVWVAVHVLI